MGEPLAEGLYDALITARLDEDLRRSPLRAGRKPIEPDERPDAFAHHVAEVLRRVLPGLKPELQLRVVNELLSELNDDATQVVAAERLISLTHEPEPGRIPAYTTHPSTRLGQAALLTNAKGDLALGNELRAELDSADSVDLLCAFIKWRGLNTMTDELTRIRDRGVPFRVITTTYMGATERRALDRLVTDFGARVKISYELERTRLHAKAWQFRRNTGFHTAYVGSSNLSYPALLEGVEWNVRLSSAATPHLLRKFAATFDTYWADPAYETYDPERDAERLDVALGEAGGQRSRDRVTLTTSGLDVRPYPHQREALESLDAERDKGHHRNLIIAATGTGKTVIAALDYRNLCELWQRRPSLLFVAHRREILEQALRIYREVLNDANFGELYVAGRQPSNWQHLFASVQTLNARDITSMAPDALEVVVIDEFHHAAAASYQALLNHLQPRELLGLTATPERTDGFDVRHYFDQRTAVEMRLWDALEADLLSPFHYFGIGDGTDLTRLTWARGSYDTTQLSNLYTGNDARARIVLTEVADKIADTSRMRALGFCVSVDHAHYMARVFNEAGIPALAVSGRTSSVEREAALSKLAAREVNIIFSVDLYNEGIDLPDIDTVLFLRPTESATVFLQQLGRGLRRTRDKPVLTALDFVGHQRKEFRFDRRFSALTGVPRKDLERHVESGFPYLPSGCQIILDRTTQAAVLQNLRTQLGSRWAAIVGEVRAHRTTSLGDFVFESGIELADLIRNQGARSWTRALREAGLRTPAGGAQEEYLLRRVPNLAHVDDAVRAQTYLDLLSDDPPDYEDLDAFGRTVARMLYFSLWPDAAAGEYRGALAGLRDEHAFREEAAQVIQHGLELARHVPRPVRGMEMNPLRSHAHYTREEIAAALDWARLDRSPRNLREGVFHTPEWGADALLVTLRKDEKNFSPTTMYRDFAISPELFHWESQSRTTQASPTGRRYLQQRSTGHQILLFSRVESDSELGTAQPYLLLGTCDLVSAEGEKPIAITWQLRRPMPQQHFQDANVQSH